VTARQSLGRGLCALAVLVVLAGCEREVILEGERLDPRALSSVGSAPLAADRAEPIALPAAVNHAAWTHRGGTPTHAIAHPALSPVPALAWSTEIGAGDDRRFRITADPVAADGRIFTLDARATVAATSAAGATLWRRDLTPDWAGRGSAGGGGMALGGGVLFVTSGYGFIAALDPASGETLWLKRFDAPVTAPPAVEGGSVHVVANNGAAYALDARDGKIVWQHLGPVSGAGMVGGAAPAVAGQTVYLPFRTGDVSALRRDTGNEVWTARIAGRRLGQANAGVTDISGDPVLLGQTLFVGSRSGRIAALDAATGEARWVATEGALGPVWPVGGSLFAVSDQGELVRLSAATGERIWGVGLGRYTETRERRRAEVVAHYGPVLAGGRVLVASNDGALRSFDPVSGALLATAEIPGGASSNPVVVGGTLYVVSRDGRLHAYR
jgi:outer membrane protein assembly factor BamB